MITKIKQKKTKINFQKLQKVFVLLSFLLIFVLLIDTNKKRINTMKSSKTSTKTRTTQPLDTKQVSNLLKLLKADEKRKELLLCACELFTGFRISDILNLTWSDLRNVKNEISLFEKKTGKQATRQINKEFKEIIKFCDDKSAKDTDFVFTSSNHANGKSMTVQGANYIIKKVFEKYNISNANASTHALRKTFARMIYEQNGRNDDALILLSEILNHGCISVTRKYIGLTDEKKNKAILSVSYL